MNFDFLKPLDQSFLNQINQLHDHSLGHSVTIHTDQNQPDLSEVKIALLGVCENRRESNRFETAFNFNNVRLALYSLFPGNWHTKIADLGDILPGASVEDTEYALHEIVSHLLQQEIIPIILGGSQDMTYAQYRAYDYRERMVNLVTIDARFDIGDTEAEITADSYVGKMIVNKPYNLFNYANLGYQTYLNPPEEISLMERLFFEAYRLGELGGDFTLAEPVMRDADFVSLDLNAVASSISNSTINQPNGFNGREICALSRYAGISDKVSSFGFYNLHQIDARQSLPLLPAEIIWYFIEGVNFRKNEENISSQNKFLKYSVPIDNQTLVFYKSKHSERWWIEIPTFVNNKLKNTSFLPCSHDDYLKACDQEIPDRWYKARRKNEL